MKVLIIEDESPAVEKLKSFIEYYDSDIVVLDNLGSVESALKWFKDPPEQADLIFMDIRLPDGVSFDIFSKVEIR